MGFLGRELESLLYWPTEEETLSYTPKSFVGNLKRLKVLSTALNNVLQSPQMQNCNIRLSTYKSANTLKKLIVCTKAGSISNISDAYGGAASDRFITEDCGVVRKFSQGMVALVDRGFNVQDLFLKHQLQAVAKRVETLTVDNRTMRVIQVSASPTPLPPQAKLFPFPLGTQTKGCQH